MHHISASSRPLRTAPGRAIVSGLAALVCVLALPAAASANNLFTLDSNAYTYGPVVTDSAGTGYVAWESTPAIKSNSSITMFCRIPRGGTCTAPITLPLPGGSTEGVDAPIAAYPVLGAVAGTVYVVAPRYVKEDTVIWTSTNGGASFSAPATALQFAHGSGVGDVLRNPLVPGTAGSPTADGIDVASYNTQVGFSETGNFAAPFKLRFEEDPNGQGSTLGFTAAGLPVTAYWNFASPYEVAFNYLISGSAKTESNWSKHQTISSGYEPRLASGPSGLFLFTTDEAGGGQPTVLNVRKFNEGTHTFGAPTTVATIPATVGGLFTSGGFYENPDTGALYVVEPLFSSSSVMRVWESTDGGASFHGERNIANIGGGFEGPPRIAVADDGGGWVTWRDEHGLQVADLNVPPPPVAPYVPPVIKQPRPPASITASTSIEGTSLTLSTPNQCIKAGAVPSSLAFKYPSHKRKGRVVVKVFKVEFKVGSSHLTLTRKKLSNKPFVGVLHVKHLIPGHKYVLTVHAWLAVEHGKPRQRFLKVLITACA